MTTVQLQKEHTNLQIVFGFPEFSPSCHFCDAGTLPVFCHVSLVSYNLRQFLGLLGNCLAPVSCFPRGPRAGQCPGQECLSGPPPTQGVIVTRGLAPAGSASLAQATTLVPSSPVVALSLWDGQCLVTMATSDRQSCIWGAGKQLVVAFHPTEHRRKGSSPPEPHQD